MSIIKAWGAGSAYQNLTPEARVMLGKWQIWCDGYTEIAVKNGKVRTSYHD